MDLVSRCALKASFVLWAASPIYSMKMSISPKAADELAFDRSTLKIYMRILWNPKTFFLQLCSKSVNRFIYTVYHFEILMMVKIAHIWTFVHHPHWIYVFRWDYFCSALWISYFAIGVPYNSLQCNFCSFFGGRTAHTLYRRTVYIARVLTFVLSVTLHWHTLILQIRCFCSYAWQQ